MLEVDGVEGFTTLPPPACTPLLRGVVDAGAGIERAGDNGASEASCECEIEYGSESEGAGAASNEECRELEKVTDVAE